MLYGEDLNKGREGKDFEIYPITFKFLHGKIMELNGFDLVYSDNEEESIYLNQKEGIETVDITLEGSKGEVVQARVYRWFWHKDIPYTKGLIVLEDDIESVKYAEKCFNEKVAIL